MRYELHLPGGYVDFGFFFRPLALALQLDIQLDLALERN